MSSIKWLLIYALTGGLLVASVSTVNADTLVLKNGSRLEGRVVEETDHYVKFEVREYVGARMMIRRSKDKVARVIRTDADQKTYCVLPIVGAIGRDEGSDTYITADAFREVLAEVQSLKPDYIVLAVKSPGGSIAEMSAIISAMEKAEGMEFIAYVVEAKSAAAVIAMACPRIYMAPHGTIGAAVPYQVGPNGTPKNIEEKFLSAIRATCRSAARMGQHSPLLIRGMSETGIELAVVERGGTPTVIEATGATGERRIKSKGSILTLTADEALACGLSSATVTDSGGIRAHLGHESWQRVAKYAGKYMADRAASEKREAVIALAKRQYAAKRDAYIARITPELLAIEDRVAQLEAQMKASAIAEQELLDAQNRQLAAIDSEYRLLMVDAAYSYDPDSAEQRVRHSWNRRRADLIAGYEPEIVEARRAYHAASIQVQNLLERHRAIIATVPPETP